MKKYKKISYIHIIIGILILGAEVYFLLLPNLKEITNAQEKIATELHRVDQLLERGQTIKKLQKDLERIEPFLEELDTIFIKESEQLQFIVALENLSIEKNVKSTFNISDLPKESEEKIIEVPLTMSIEGTFTDTLDFIIALQTLDFYINIKTINIITESASESNLVTNIKGITYWQKI